MEHSLINGGAREFMMENSSIHMGIAVDSESFVYVVDTGNHKNSKIFSLMENLFYPLAQVVWESWPISYSNRD